MADKLIFDINAFETAYNELDQELNEMIQLRDKLTTSVDNLKNTGWKSEAGQAFMNKYNLQWKTNVNNYINVLEYMRDNVKYAKGDYQEVIDEMNKLELKETEVSA